MKDSGFYDSCIQKFALFSTVKVLATMCMEILMRLFRCHCSPFAIVAHCMNSAAAYAYSEGYVCLDVVSLIEDIRPEDPLCQ